MLLPAPPALAVVTGCLAAGVAASVWPSLQPAWLAMGGMAAVAGGIDAWRLRERARNVTASRVLPAILPVGRRHGYHVRLTGPRDMRVAVVDQLPLGRAESQPPIAVHVPAGARGARVPLVVEPSVRGRYSAGAIVTRLRSPWRLWDWQSLHRQDGAVRVFPDFSQAGGGSVEAVDLRVPPAGARLAPRRGHGLEFKELRDYREGDALRLVDWKATARRGRPITREYEDQRDQQILLVLDCGLRLRTRDGTLSHFDHALNAALRLAAVALAQGDAVGCATIAHDHARLLPPRKSRATLQRLVQGLYDLQPGHRVPDYLADARALHDRLRRHSLIVLLTALRDEDEEQLIAATRLLRRRHRVTVASLREQVVDERLRAGVVSLDDAARWTTAIEYAQVREALIGRLRQRGVDVLDVPPSHLAVALSNHYWRLKRAGSL
ncbi:MAG: DUF58 domain-containing protein [Acidobacteria bacterium]|nr:DUF58 domain-containing protein [Acidobacteriota bacterium]